MTNTSQYGSYCPSSHHYLHITRSHLVSVFGCVKLCIVFLFIMALCQCSSCFLSHSMYALCILKLKAESHCLRKTDVKNQKQNWRKKVNNANWRRLNDLMQPYVIILKYTRPICFLLAVICCLQFSVQRWDSVRFPPSFCINKLIDIVIVRVLFMLQFLRKSISEETSWYCGTYHIFPPSHRPLNKSIVS